MQDQHNAGYDDKYNPPPLNVAALVCFASGATMAAVVMWWIVA